MAKDFSDSHISHHSFTSNVSTATCFMLSSITARMYNRFNAPQCFILLNDYIMLYYVMFGVVVGVFDAVLNYFQSRTVDVQNECEQSSSRRENCL